MNNDDEDLEVLEDIVIAAYALEGQNNERTEEELDALGAAFLVGSALAARDQKQAARRRLYLTRADLLQNPQGDTPWQKVWRGRSDRVFITTMGIDVATFDYLLKDGHFEQ